MAPNTYRKLQDKHVLVIGGSSGIGFAVAEAALSSGANITISSSNQAKVDQAVASLASQYPDRSVHGIASDLSKPSVEGDITSLFETAQRTATINHVVYTAADSLSLGGLGTVTAGSIQKAAHMRMVVPILVAKVAARYLPKTNLSSLTITTGSVAERPGKGWAVISYFAGGLVSLTRALAVDLAPVRVNAVQPGVVDTGLWDYMEEEQKAVFVKGIEEKTLTGKFASVQDVAEAYLWLLRDGNATGTVAGTDGGSLLV
ncbi:hypothetical protein B0T16DRAFT_384993 [Cercophora newfieldiana]|uniref:Uncharacterized protein n=1 Tax=Cercophora newfieldiana TaxID=92897 RepID=A0AA39YPD3_9PEZI|nr:hypothetical protein B0T16DRAFT_384993 [Cercophora newfieldiana]